MTPFDVYKTYLGLKNHFTKDKYDYHRYNGKTRASLQSFYKRKDRYWFEKMSRQKNDQEVVNFFCVKLLSLQMLVLCGLGNSSVRGNLHTIPGRSAMSR